MSARLVASEFLPASGAAAQEVVLLHGWGTDREIWRPLIPHLRAWANVTLVDIPGCAPALQADCDVALPAVLSAILDCCPPKAVFLGWSLGGQLATEIACSEPARVAAVVTLCSNPRFVGARGWPGMVDDQFEAFAQSAQENLPAALRRFHALQSIGSPPARRWLRQWSGPETAGVSSLLNTGLSWLRELDCRDALACLPKPQLHLLADCDSLVPIALAVELETMLQASGAHAQVKILSGCSHVAPIDVPATIAQTLLEFLERSDLLAVCAAAQSDFDKRDVAASFSKAAPGYDAAAALQRDVGAALLNRVDSMAIPAQTVLDLGCGTGHFTAALHQRYPRARHIGIDLAPGMVDFARARSSHGQAWVVGDAESLPLAADSVDLVFSSLALQWCSQPQHLFAELARVLRPGGRCVFATLGPDTLKELRESWASVDQRQHVNRFPPAEALAHAACARGTASLDLETEWFVMYYERVNELLLELKALGAHNVNRNRAHGLTSRSALRGMMQAYEQWRCGGRLPATYEVVFGVLEAA